MINGDKVNQDLIKVLYNLLKDKPQACEFVLAYRDLIHMSDDVIDNKVIDPEKLLELSEIHAHVFSLPYYRQNGDLRALEFVINNTYADSVEWENSSVEWKKRDAAVLRHCGIDMFLYIIAKECGRAVLRSVSSKFRTQCHEMHMNDNFEPI